jgi:hypothetical protein
LIRHFAIIFAYAIFAFHWYAFAIFAIISHYAH